MSIMEILVKPIVGQKEDIPRLSRPGTMDEPKEAPMHTPFYYTQKTLLKFAMIVAVAIAVAMELIK